MIYHGKRARILAQALVGLQRICIQGRSGLHVLANFSLKGFLPAILYDLGAHLAGLAVFATFQNSHDHGFVFAACAGDFASANRGVHVAGFATHEGFVSFNVSVDFVWSRHAERNADSMIHEPSGFLSDANGPVNLVGTDSVLAIDDLPHGKQPLIQAQGRIFEDGPGF